MTGTEYSASLTFEDSPSLAWLPTVLFSGVGAAFLALGINEGNRGSEPLAVSLAFAVGSIAIGVAAWTLSHCERITVSFDDQRRLIFFSGRLIWRTRQFTLPIRQVSNVEAEEKDDGDGGSMWRPVIVLLDGQRFPMMANWRHDKELVLDVCNRAQQLLIRN